MCAGLNGLGAHIAIINGKGVIEVVNAAWRKFAAENGGDERMCEGASYLAVCDGARGEDAATARAFARAIRAVLAGRRRDFEAEYPCHSPEERRWFMGRVTRVPGGGPARAIVAHENITVRKRAEEALREQHHLLESLINSAAAAVFSVDREYRYTSFNEQAAAAVRRMYGRRIALGQSMWETMTVAADRRSAKANIDRVLGGEEFVRAVESGREGRSRRAYEIAHRPIRGADGSVIGAAVAARDVTERKAAEEALRESEERYRQLVEACPDTIYVTRDKKIIMINRAGLDLLGASRREQILGHSPLEFVHPDCHAEVERRIQELLKARRAAIVGRRKYVRLNGEVRTVDVNVARITFMGAPALQVVVRDVTEQERAEEAMREQRSAMAHLSRVASVGELTTAIAHQVNQPLGASLLYAETFREVMRNTAGHPKPMVAMMEKLIAALARAREVLERIREFTRKRVLKRAPVSAGALLRNAVLLLEHELRTAGVAVRLRLGRGLPAVLGDRVFMQQVLVNLMTNALEAMAESGRRPRRLTLSAAQNGEGQCVISVADTGKGLAPAVADKVFEAFVTTKRRGLGLGLSLARTIVEEHGGRIWHEAAPGGGAVFRFTIPAALRKGTHNEERAGEGLHRG